MALFTTISSGTHFSDGLRSGVVYSGDIPAAEHAFNPTERLSYSSYNSYGFGVQHSPIVTWTLQPLAANAANVVAVLAAADVQAAGNLPLTGGDANSSARLITSNGKSWVQLDWPRVVSVTIAGAALAADRRVTIFGTDWYGNNLQHTYVVRALGTYPAVVNGHTQVPSLVPAAKAFYTINRVHIDGALVGQTTISLGVADIIGLPFVLDQLGDISSISWDGLNVYNPVPAFGSTTLVAGTIAVAYSSIKANSNIIVSHSGALNQNSGTLSVSAINAGVNFTITSSNGADTGAVNWTLMPQLQGKNAIIGNTGVPTAITGDVRGLYALPDVSNGVKRLSFTYHTLGANTWLNQLSAAQQEQKLNTNVPVVGVEQAPLQASQLYGRSQFYTGNPS